MLFKSKIIPFCVLNKRNFVKFRCRMFLCACNQVDLADMECNSALETVLHILVVIISQEHKLPQRYVPSTADLY